MIEIIIIMPMIMLIGLAKTIKNQWDVHKKKDNYCYFSDL